MLDKLTDIQILSKAVSKAEQYSFGCMVFPDIMEDKNYYSRIFDIDFARKFWGDKDVDDMGRDLDTAWEELWKNEGQHIDKDEFDDDFGFDIPTKIAWQYHLEKMVTMEEPLKYLEKFLC